MSLVSFIQNIYHNSFSDGYKSDQKGIIRRYYREYDNWQSHLNNCKNFIDDKTQNIEGGKVAILGSGWLLDVPLDELERQFNEVYLFDIYHPPVIRRKVAKSKSIKLITCDLTNGLIHKAKIAFSFEQFLLGLEQHKPFSFSTEFDMVISLNLLNQLDILLCDFLIKRFKPSDDEIIVIRQKIQSQHICLLQNQKSCLISDWVEVNTDKYANKHRKDLIFCNIEPGKVERSWDWVFDTNYTYHQNYQTTFKVNAICF